MPEDIAWCTRVVAGIANGSLLYWWLKTAVPKMRGGITSARGGVVFGIVTLRGEAEVYGGDNDSIIFNRTEISKGCAIWQPLRGNEYVGS